MLVNLFFWQYVKKLGLDQDQICLITYDQNILVVFFILDTALFISIEVILDRCCMKDSCLPGFYPTLLHAAASLGLTSPQNQLCQLSVCDALCDGRIIDLRCSSPLRPDLDQKNKHELAQFKPLCSGVPSLLERFS